MRKTRVDMRPFLHRFFALRFLNANALLYKRILVSVYHIAQMFWAIKDYVPRLFRDIISVVVAMHCCIAGMFGAIKDYVLLLFSDLVLVVDIMYCCILGMFGTIKEYVPRLFRGIVSVVVTMHCRIPGMFGVIKNYLPRFFRDIVPLVVERLIVQIIKHILTVQIMKHILTEAEKSVDALLVPDPVSELDGIEKWLFHPQKNTFLISIYCVALFSRFAFNQWHVRRHSVPAVRVFFQLDVVQYFLLMLSRWF